jgi:hypothetical protein
MPHWVELCRRALPHRRVRSQCALLSDTRVPGREGSGCRLAGSVVAGGEGGICASQAGFWSWQEAAPPRLPASRSHPEGVGCHRLCSAQTRGRCCGPAGWPSPRGRTPFAWRHREGPATLRDNRPARVRNISPLGVCRPSDCRHIIARRRIPRGRISASSGCGGPRRWPMSTVLIETKLHSPILRPAIVPRPRLVERLATSDASLGLVVAPPGFGKTTLLVQWQSSGEHS